MKRLIFLMLIPLVSFGQFGVTKKSLAPTDSVGNLKRSDTTWVAYKSWVEGQGYGSGSGGDTTGMLTRTDTSWVATRFALNSYVAQSETTAWLPSWSDILALHYLLPSDSTSIRNYSSALYALVGHNHSGTYLTPSDSNTIRAYSTALYALAGHNHTGTYQPAGTYLVPSDTNLTVHRTDTTWLAYKEWVQGQGYGIGTGDIEGVGVTAPITGGGTTGSVTIGIDTTAALAYAKALIAGKLSVSDSTTFLAYVKDLIAGKQAAGTYLVPSDTNLVLKRTDTTWVAYKAWVEGQNYGSGGFDSTVSLAYIKYLDGLKLNKADVDDSLGAVSTHILPSTSDVFTLGSAAKKWKDLYVYDHIYAYSMTLTGPFTIPSMTLNNGFAGTLSFTHLADYQLEITSNTSLIVNTGAAADLYLHAGGNVLIGSGWSSDSALTVEEGISARAVKATNVNTTTVNSQALISTETSVGSIPYMEDATTLGTVTLGGALDMDGATLNLAARTLFSAGLVDSVKTTDTLFVGIAYPAATLTNIVYSSARSSFYKVRLEIVDSLYQTASPTLLDTTSVITQRRERSSAVAGGTFSVSAGKIVRAVFESVGTMPKQFNVSLVGTN